jgi:diguanylate cyclase (GGDEF)-like protein
MSRSHHYRTTISETWPLLLSAAISLGSGILLWWQDTADLASIGLALGAMLVTGACIAATLLPGTLNRSSERLLFQLGSLAGHVFILSGLTWMVAAELMADESLQERNASLLLLSGGALFVIIQLGNPNSAHFSSAIHALLPSTFMAAAVAWVAVAGYARASNGDFRKDSVSWSLAAMFSVLGLLLVMVTVSRLTMRPLGDAKSSQSLRSDIGWCLAGIAFLTLGLILVRDPSYEAVWWMPVLSIGMLLASTPSATPDFGKTQTWRRCSRQPVRGSILTMLALIACLSAALIAILLRGDPKSTDWALAAVSGWVFAISVLTVCSSLVRYQSNVSELGSRVVFLSRLSQTDPLTGISNRRALDERLAAEIQRAARFGHPLAIGLIDIDDFKMINDVYGHAAGDLVLQRLAALLVRELRTIDVIGRYGGEEFLIILPETDGPGALTAASRVLDAVRSDRHHYLGTGWQITVSIGIAVFELNGRTSEELLGAADVALYQAKRLGKDQLALTEPSS